MGLQKFFINFHLKECIDWHSKLAKINCYKRQRWRHMLYFTHIAALWLMHS